MVSAYTGAQGSLSESSVPAALLGTAGPNHSLFAPVTAPGYHSQHVEVRQPPLKFASHLSSMCVHECLIEVAVPFKC